MTHKRAFSTSRPDNRRGVVAAVACLLAFGSGAVLAQDTATINVTGSITGSTCSLPISNITLTIGPVNRNVFTGIGSASEFSNIGTIVAGGPDCNAAGVSMTFTANADPNERTLFAVNGGAAGVGIKLESQSNNSNGEWRPAIPNDTGSPLTNLPGSQIFRASYVQSATTITNGDANATITVLVTYT